MTDIAIENLTKEFQNFIVFGHVSLDLIAQRYVQRSPLVATSNPHAYSLVYQILKVCLTFEAIRCSRTLPLVRCWQFLRKSSSKRAPSERRS